jgi:scyllo-inositol 2-dehydrogenase (NADP+)
MRVVIVGYGVQGRKRRYVAGTEAVCAVDTVASGVEYRDVREVALNRYDAAIVCTPNVPKVEILRYLLANGKHVLVEKPLHAKRVEELLELQSLASRTGAVCYTAYNHRFEPHFVRIRELIRSGELGKIYRCRMFYGNGTARLVRESPWRDQGGGVLSDLGSHLLDAARFWFGDVGEDFHLLSASRFENRAPDHVIVVSESAQPKLEMEMTLLSWRNNFTCDILAERGSAHIESLCKWGPSRFTRRTRILPSGRPPEESVVLVQDDPTWKLEYDYFKHLCGASMRTDLSNDLWLHRILTCLESRLSAAIA